MSALWLIIGLICVFLAIFVEGRSELGDTRVILSAGFGICAIVSAFVTVLELLAQRKGEEEDPSQWGERLERRVRGGKRR